MPDDPAGTQARGHVTTDANGAVTGVVVDTPGTGYSSAPGVTIHDGTVANPINNAGAGASATATINVLSVGIDTVGAGYTSAPTVSINDATGSGSGAAATAAIDTGAISKITVTAPGSGYVTPGGIKKFQDACRALRPGELGRLPDRRHREVHPGRSATREGLLPGIKADQYESRSSSTAPTSAPASRTPSRAAMCRSRRLNGSPPIRA